MIPLVLSILSSTLIFVIFKLFQRFGINTFQAIVVNYFTAAILGFALFHDEWNPQAMQESSWMIAAGFTAFLFIGLFFIMGKSSQVNGVASTSVAVKMSMAISLIIMIQAYDESLDWKKILGIGFAFLGVYLVSSSSKKTKNVVSAAWMLVLLFLGSGILDFTLNYVQKFSLGSMPLPLFTAIGLGTAGIIGFSILLVNLIRGKEKIALKNIIAGIVLGVPNYFSIYLLLLSYQSTGWNDTTVLAITNVSVVLCSAIFGFIAFKEKATIRKIIGLISAILAITTLYIASCN
ncbi:MAG: EamA family transporter [Crocinitomicaceae bacterium]|nr:EamA family transporter [Crocinitomicaceae bacterium]